MTTVDSESAGFDIYSEPRSGDVQQPQATLCRASVVLRCYRVNLWTKTGESHFIGVFRRPVVDIAVPLKRSRDRVAPSTR